MNRIKSILKSLKLNESTISMLLGAIIIVVVGVLIVNFLRGQSGGETIPAVGTEEEERTLPATHTVREGEDLWKISEEYYGTGYNWTDIAEANNISNPNQIAEGQELTIPDVEAAGPTATVVAEGTTTPAPTGTIAATATIAQASPTSGPVATVTPVETEEGDEVVSTPTIEGTSYTVIKGDTLWDIAVRAYGDGYKWTEIASANNLVNPNIIHAGNVFTLPR